VSRVGEQWPNFGLYSLYTIAAGLGLFAFGGKKFGSIANPNEYPWGYVQ
jgi:hypothetical protein